MCSPRAKADADCHPSPSAARVGGVVVGRGDTTSCALSPARFRQSASGVHATLSVVRRPRTARECFVRRPFFSLRVSSRCVSVSIDDGCCVPRVTISDHQCRSRSKIISLSDVNRVRLIFPHPLPSTRQFENLFDDLQATATNYYRSPSIFSLLLLLYLYTYLPIPGYNFLS